MSAETTTETSTEKPAEIGITPWWNAFKEILYRWDLSITDDLFFERQTEMKFRIDEIANKANIRGYSL